jgi:hypothetical protein
MQRSWNNGHLLVMKPIIREIKNLLENAEPGVTVVGCTCDEPLACPIGEALWLEYRQRNRDGIKVPPVDWKDCTDPELLPYAVHVHTCDDCNEVWSNK